MYDLKDCWMLKKVQAYDNQELWNCIEGFALEHKLGEQQEDQGLAINLSQILVFLFVIGEYLFTIFA